MALTLLSNLSVNGKVMKLALASDLYIDRYPDDQGIDWRLVRRWTGVDVLVICGNISGSLERTRMEVLAARAAFERVIFVEGDLFGDVCDLQAGASRPLLQRPEDLFGERLHDALLKGGHSDSMW